MTYFDSFGVKQIPNKIKKITDDRNIITNIFRIQAYDSKMFGYFDIGFNDFMFKGSTRVDFTNLLSLHDLKKNDELVLYYVFK